MLQGLEVKVWRGYEDFVDELAARFPAERRGIEAFYGEAWRVFNALNSLELKSLEEPRYLLGGALALLRVCDMHSRFSLLSQGLLLQQVDLWVLRFTHLRLTTVALPSSAWTHDGLWINLVTVRPSVACVAARCRLGKLEPVL